MDHRLLLGVGDGRQHPASPSAEAIGQPATQPMPKI